jgi:hypothetical protein
MSILDLHDNYGVANFNFGPVKRPDEFKVGELARYSSGVTALGICESRHVGGWHLKQCMGGYTFVGYSMHAATDEDRRIWADCAARRGK